MNANVSYSNDDITLVTNEVVTGEIHNDDTNNYNFDMYNSSNEIDEHLSYYDWVGDTATTSHIVNMKEYFTNLQPLATTSVSGVGNIKTCAKG